jgi:hypothetical protein
MKKINQRDLIMVTPLPEERLPNTIHDEMSCSLHPQIFLVGVYTAFAILGRGVLVRERELSQQVETGAMLVREATVVCQA